MIGRPSSSLGREMKSGGDSNPPASKLASSSHCTRKPLPQTTAATVPSTRKRLCQPRPRSRESPFALHDGAGQCDPPQDPGPRWSGRSNDRRAKIDRCPTARGRRTDRTAGSSGGTDGHGVHGGSRGVCRRRVRGDVLTYQGTWLRPAGEAPPYPRAGGRAKKIASTALPAFPKRTKNARYL